jgi:hypothetical protein
MLLFRHIKIQQKKSEPIECNQILTCFKGDCPVKTKKPNPVIGGTQNAPIHEKATALKPIIFFPLSCENPDPVPLKLLTLFYESILRLPMAAQFFLRCFIKISNYACYYC